jgi:hypothetical protein
MSSFVPESSPSHEERVLLPAATSASDIDIVRAVPSSNILPAPSHVTSKPKQLLTDVSWGPRFRHYVHSPRPSINHWLPIDILVEIFFYAVEANHMSPYQLVTVCRRWWHVISSIGRTGVSQAYSPVTPVAATGGHRVRCSWKTIVLGNSTHPGS